MSLPILETERLTLRGFCMEDAPEVKRLVSAREIASTTRSIPHPCEDGMAEAWVARRIVTSLPVAALSYAIVLRESCLLIGSIGLSLNAEDCNAELGYWIGMDYWGQGYASEAARALLQLGFTQLGLHRIHASHLTRNPASGRVMQKIGMRYEGCLRQHLYKWGVFEDLACYALLADEWRCNQLSQRSVLLGAGSLAQVF